MADKSKIAIIGLGLVGASMGAALQREAGNFVVVGHDKEPEQAGAAKKRGDVQKTEWNLHRACDGAELVITAVPLRELPELYRQISGDLAPGALILSLVDVMGPALAAARGNLSREVHFVAGHPVITGLTGPLEPRADLFEKSVFCLAADVETHPDALELASNLARRVGAEPLFIDVQEHDGILALVEQLPQLLGLALMQMSSESSGWREARRLAGRRFAQATDVGRSPEGLASSLHANREHLVQRLAQFQEELAAWQQILADVNEDELALLLKKIIGDREQWESVASRQAWGEEASPSTQDEGPGFLRQMFFGNLLRKRGNDQR